MPRLRRLKNYDTLHTESETSGLPNGSPARSFADDTRRSVSGWWSDTQIISSIPDAKLREAYHRYKSLAEQCLAELTARAHSGVNIRAEAWFDVRSGMHRFVPVLRSTTRTCSDDKRSYQRKTTSPKKTGKAKQLKLSAAQMAQALQALKSLSELKSKQTEVNK